MGSVYRKIFGFYNIFKTDILDVLDLCSYEANVKNRTMQILGNTQLKYMNTHIWFVYLDLRKRRN